MKKLLFVGIAILLNIGANAQINMNDSTAQVIGYWDLNEMQSYVITQEKFKIKNADTTSREFIKYVVDITVVDSTANSYVLDWLYRDYEVESDNDLVKKLSAITQDMTVRIRTDEFGAFEEVINWEEMKNYIWKVTDVMREQVKDIPNMDKVVDQVKTMFSTKESIEMGVVKDIQQFYTFHGGLYELGEEYNAVVEVANLYGGKPFDSEIKVWLDELNPADNNFIIRMKQKVDSEQLTNETLNYLATMAESLEVPAPKKEDFPPLTNNTWVASRVHDSGWIIYSVNTKEVQADGVTGVEERIIEIQ